MFSLILSMSIWGTLGAFVLWSKATAINIAFYRCFFGAVTAGAFALKEKETIVLDRSLVISGLAGIFLILDWAFLFKSFKVSSITIGNISYCLQPFILVMLGCLFQNQKINLKTMLLLIACLCGVLLTTDIHTLHNNQGVLSGTLFALLAGLFYSIFTLLMKKSTQSGYSILFIQLAFGGITLLPFVSLSIIDFSAIPYLIIIGIIHTTFAYLLYYRSLKKINISYVAALSYLDPIVAIVTDLLFFKARLSPMQISGIIITLVSALSFTKFVSAD